MTVTRWTRLAGVWLLAMGIFIVGLAAYGIASSRWACDQPGGHVGYRFACDVAWVLGAGAVVVAALHVMAAVSIWRGHFRGAVAGIVLSLLGLVACSGFVQDERWWVALAVAAGYLATSLVLASAMMGWWQRGRQPPGR